MSNTTNFEGPIMVRGKGTGFVNQPDHGRIHIRPIVPDATPSDISMKVVVEITKWTEPLLDPVAKITETLGHAGDHETEMQAIIRSGGFSKEFPESVQKAAQELFEF